jgi:hydrogenase expression/formation protein HypC
MCVGIPMQVVTVDGTTATCRGRLGPQSVDVQLVAPVAPGEWLLIFLGAARARLDVDEASKIDQALNALAAIERGEPLDVAAFFADLVDREPVLPAHLRGQT